MRIFDGIIIFIKNLKNCKFKELIYMEVVLCLFSIGFLLGTMMLHINFWADYGKGDINKSVVGCLFTLPLFPIFGIVQMVRKFPFKIKIEKR